MLQTLPAEILTQIAYQLPSRNDVRRFRLANSAFAAAAFPALFRSIQVINTMECFEKLESLAKSPNGSIGAVKHVTLYHGEWPEIPSKEQWDVHPLVIRRNAVTSAEDAYSNYCRFLVKEASRDVVSDCIRLREILPGLESLTVSHLHSWRPSPLNNAHYDHLKQRIGVVPCFESSSGILFTVLPILAALPRLSSLNIQGNLDVRGMRQKEDCSQVKRLNVQSLLSRDGLTDNICNFLSSFPNLTHLAAGLSPGGPVWEQKLPLNMMHHSKLTKVHFSRLYVTEDELAGFVCRHKLSELSLNLITLFSGGWESFFARIRPVNGPRALEDSNAGSYAGLNPCNSTICFQTSNKS